MEEIKAMKTYKMYIGLNDKFTKKQEISTEKAVSIINDTALNILEGYTLYTGTGIFTHGDGERITENTIILELISFDDTDAEKLKTIREKLLVSLRQEAIYINVYDTYSI